MPSKDKIWVVVADGGRARILSPTAENGRLESALDSDLVGSRAKSGEQWTDRPGRERRRGGAGRQALEPQTDPHQHEKTMLAKRVAEVLDASAHAGRCERIVLVAAPHVLGDIRSALKSTTLDKVVVELDKDLTTLSEHQLTERLGEYLEG